jgi:alpha-galactosidase
MVGTVWSAAIEQSMKELNGVYIPEMAEPVYLDRPIIVESGSRIVVHPKTEVRMIIADTEHCLIRNRHIVSGQNGPVELGKGADRDILIEGGIWSDQKNNGAGPQGFREGKKGLMLGSQGCFVLSNVENVTIRKVTIKDYSSFGIQIGNARNFLVEDVCADGIKDGVHVDGPAEYGIIRRIGGPLAGDDVVALNAWDWRTSSLTFGSITDILVQDTDVEKGACAIRILPGIKRFPDGSTLECRVSRCLFSRIRNCHSFKIYDQPNIRSVKDDYSVALGTASDLHFEDVHVQPLKLSSYYDQSKTGVFELCVHASGLFFENIHLDYVPGGEYPPYLLTVGPKSRIARIPFAASGTQETFNPQASPVADNVVLGSVFVRSESGQEIHLKKRDAAALVHCSSLPGGGTGTVVGPLTGRDSVSEPPAGMIRSGDWKLSEHANDGRLELYQLRDDPEERRNLVGTQPEKTKELHRQLLAWRERARPKEPAARPPGVAAFERNRGKTPPMGWNSWNTFGKQVSARLVEEIADAAKRYRLDEVGYRYLVMDDGWQLRELGSNGELVPNPVAFPQGIAPVAHYVRSRGFELGIYSSPNLLSCANFAGSLGHEAVHVRQFAAWGCTFVKYDYCPVRNGEPGLAPASIVARYRVFGDALKVAAPHIRFAICEKGWAGQLTTRQRTPDSPPVTGQQRRQAFDWCREVGGVMWRTTGDIRPTWPRLMQILDEQDGLASLAGPGGFNDPDMLEVGNGGLTEAENRAHFTLWCVLNAPLFLGNDLRSVPESVLRIITNREVIDLNQDLLCRQAEKVVDTGDVEIFTKPLANGDVGVCVLNRAAIPQKVAINWDKLGLKQGAAWRVRDLWALKDLGAFTDQLNPTVPSHDVAAYRMSRVE